MDGRYETVLPASTQFVLTRPLMNLLLLAAGIVMEPVAAITILTPVLLPIAMALGLDPVHFGIMMVLNLMIGLLTPPVGMVLYVLARVTDTSFEAVVRTTMPFLIPLITVLILVTYVSAVSMWLPTLLYR